MSKIKKWIVGLVCMMVLFLISGTYVFADDIGAGGTGQGNISGSNVYTFSYIYDAGADAID